MAQTEFECLCGKGTYVRALARDMGRILGCYGHISVLRRTKVGHFSENNAISLEKLEELVHNAALFEAILPVETSLDDILALSFGYGPAERLRRGQPVRLTDRNLILTGNMPAYAHSEGKVVAIGCVEEGMFTPDRVFNY